LFLDPPKNPFPIEFLLREKTKWPNLCAIYIADCCREASKNLIQKREYTIQKNIYGSEKEESK
jgi:hypothetical protein